MIYQASTLAVTVFAIFVATTLALSFWFGAKAKSAAGYFAAGGQIHWFVNGVAFAGDYLSAASFLGICGMIAFYGYDGFLYSIGFLAGWIVALFVVAEPLKRMGRFTFADALDSRFHSRGIKLSAAISTLVVSVIYLIPQMVGAGVLIKPLLGFSHWQGVVMVGTIVVLIVVTAGMVSTTYVQFIKGSLLVLFSGILTVLILQRGFVADTSSDSMQPQVLTTNADGSKLVNGNPHGKENDLRPVGHITKLPGGVEKTGPLGPLEFFRTLLKSEVVVWRGEPVVANEDGSKSQKFVPKVIPGDEILRPGNHAMFKGIRGGELTPKINIVSLMLALFGGTAALPHILIRYYTVKDQASARKSTVVGIATIGTFYILTLYLGLGAMASGTLDVTSSDMAAPLLAKSFGDILFAVISAIAFTTVLGTVSGLIVAASGTVVYDLLVGFGKVEMNDKTKVRVGKAAAVVVGVIAIGLGILFEKMSVSFLVGWAFGVAASANLPSLIMLLFWKRTTKQGITAAVLVGLTTSLTWILLSKDAFEKVYEIKNHAGFVPFNQPAIITIPLGFLTLVLVSLLTQKTGTAAAVAARQAALGKT